MSESTSEFVQTNPPFAYADGSIDPETFRAAASADPAGFWEDRAKELEWFAPWDQVVDDSNAPFFEWFTGAKTNIVLNAIDRHLSGPYKNKLALIWVGEDGIKDRSFSYFSLNREVNTMANVLKSMGVRRGDRVTIYLPRIPEVVFAMLACAKIGAIHSVIFAGFSPDALAARIDHSESKLVITADGSWVNGAIFPLKKIVDEAIRFSASVENILVVKNTGEDVAMEPLRDHWYHDLAALPIAHGMCETEQMDSTDPLFILYTSGSTGTPKAIVHAHGGYMVGTYTTLKYTFDIRDEDRWWCTADPGWITGHSYLVYGPLLCGATIFLYEGGPTFPTPDRWWQLIEHYGITTFYTSPTAVRTLLRFGEAWPGRHDLSSLRLLGTVGEPINPEAWQWLFKVIGQGRCPIMDTWWQTETGQFQITPTPSMPLKPGSAGKPFFGQAVDILNEDGQPVADGEEGFLVLKNPWPAMMRTLYKEPERYISTYWSKYPGVYLTGDSARRDADGYLWVIGRTDDVIKVSGHRLGTAEVESALASHPAVGEAAVIGLPHEVKGHAIQAFVVLRMGFEGSPALAEELRQHVASRLSPIAKPEWIEFTDKLPKTRSGKIMRRVLRARALGEPEGDLTTLDD